MSIFNSFGVRVALFVLCLAPAVARADEPKPVPGVELTRDVVYGKGGDEDLKLDLARPIAPTTRPSPLMVVIHGGGWTAGNKSELDPLAQMLAARGYVAASVGYRFAPAHPWPAQINDVKCAVRFLRAHAAEYHFDPEHVGAMGFSAGAHLSMMLGVTEPADKLEGDGGSPDQSSKVQAVVSFSGPTDLLAPDIPAVDNTLLKNFLAGTATEKPELYRQASPITYLAIAGRSAPPMLLFQGSKDNIVPVTQAFRMSDALTQAGIPGRIEVILGAGHGFPGDELWRSADSAFRFADKYLKPQ